MLDPDNEKNLPHENRDDFSEPPARSTGPRLPEEKANSSMEPGGRGEPGPSMPGSRVVHGGSLNRLTHGGRSETLVLPFEDPAEFEFTIQSWTNTYDPQAHRPPDTLAVGLGSGRCARLDEDATAATLVYETAKAHWFFARNQKRLHQIEIRLPSDAWLWTEENIKLFNNFSRYKTAAERSFYRAFNNLEAYYKRQHDRGAQAEKAHRAMDARSARAQAQMAKIELEWLKKKQERAAEEMVVAQYIDVMANDCDTTTTWLPSNDQILKLAENTGKTPQFVNRYLFFLNGVPPEYIWTNPNHIQRTEPAIGLQRMFYSDWLKVVEKEKATGHAQPRETVLAGFRERAGDQCDPRSK